MNRFPARPPSLGIAVAILLLVSACYEVQPPPKDVERPDRTAAKIDGKPVQEGGDLVMGLSAEPDALDPTTSSSLYTRYVMSSICEKLYDIDEQGSLVPQLASELPTLRDGGRRVSIPLRKDVQFGDGTPFDAHAVKVTLQRHLNKDDSARASEMGPVASIETPNSHEVVLEYEKPFAPITAAFADRAGMIMSPKALGELGENFAQSPTCVGPFKFVDRVPQTSIKVERDPNYYAADEVHLDTITYRIMTDANIRAANLRSDDVQVIDTVSPQDVDALEREDGIGVLQTGSLGYQGVTFNVGNVKGVGQPPGKVDTPIANDPRIRQAFEHSIDREALVNSVFNNWFEPACSPISPDSEFATPASNECAEYSPERSRELLAEAGVETPLPLKMIVANTPDSLRFGQALQAAVKDGGFDVELVPMEYTTLLDTQDRGDFESLQLGWSGRIDPHGNMTTFLATGEGNNVAGYSSQRVDDLLVKAARQTDPGQRAKTYGEAISLVHKDDPIIYLYRQRNLTAYSEDIAGIATYADGVVRLSRAAFLEES